MEYKFKINHGKPYPLGASVINDDTVNFAVVLNTTDSCGVILTDKKTKKDIKLDFCCSNKVGNIRCMQVNIPDFTRYEYNFFEGDKIINDPYSKKIVGNDTWGKTPASIRSAIVDSLYDWESDKHPLLGFEKSIIYALHVRGFTKHKSSNVKNPGTFEGLTEKIDYLKDLGITTVELMPVYNFIELEKKIQEQPEVNIEPYADTEPVLNYWGYKNSFYFAPKSSYAAKGTDPCDSFKNMVKKFHSNGMEVILQFYFPDSIKQGYIFEVLKFWMQEYHVDGFHLMGNKLPLGMIGTEPMLANTKIIATDFPVNDIYEHNNKPNFKNLAISTDTYMYNMRRFLKSDEGLIGQVCDYIKSQPDKLARVHYITNTNSFTLMDLVSYDRKHNEDNGENNRDGAAYNGSWNCGIEGNTRKKSINTLRMKQIKNAIILNLISQSTPLIVAGDEFGNSQKGNNNPYCHDNSLTWINWNDLDRNREIYDFMKAIIAFRNENSIFHMKDAFKLNDYNSIGFPDLSFHGEEAWKLEYDALNRQVGVLYNCNYGDEAKNQYIYIAINMHWTNHDYAIPKLPNHMKWNVFCNTDNSAIMEKYISKNMITVKERSIVILMSSINDK